MPDTAASLYLDLVKRSLLNVTHVDLELTVDWLASRLDRARTDQGAATVTRKEFYTLEDSEGGRKHIEAIQQIAVDGRKPRTSTHLMMGTKRLNNIHECLETIRSNKIPGDFLEAGIWKGGGTIFMRAFLKAYGIEDRIVWAADSFQGVPPPSLEADKGYDLSAEKFPFLSIPQPRVESLFRRYGLLDDQVRFLPGWFKDTLPTASVEKLALLRIDGDLYESTMDALRPLYDKVSPGGFIIIDDYNDIPPCKRAVDDFRAERGITDPIVEIDWTGIYWRKSWSGSVSA